MLFRSFVFPSHDTQPQLLPKADELPHTLPDLPNTKTILPQTSIAHLRIQYNIPLQKIKHNTQTNPRTQPHNERHAHLLHPKPNMRRTHLTTTIHPRTTQRLRTQKLLPRIIDEKPKKIHQLRQNLKKNNNHTRQNNHNIQSKTNTQPK